MCKKKERKKKNLNYITSFSLLTKTAVSFLFEKENKKLL